VKAWWREALGLAPGGAAPESAPAPGAATRRALAAMVALSAALFATLALLRWHTFHNETFDLAFYARMAWGEVHLDGYDPIVGANARGLHLAWILIPLGLIGAVLGQAPTLLVAQAVALSATAIPLARMGARHLGRHGGVVVAAAWLLHPNVSHVASNEFHPGSVAALPLAMAADALDRRSAPGLVLGALGVLACREDLGLVTMLIGVAATWLALRDRGAPGARTMARTGTAIAIGSLAYVLVFVLVLHPMLAPPRGSLELHFGRFGSSTTDVAAYVLTHPLELLDHLSATHRLLYLAVITAPFALLPRVRPGYLLLASPILAINLLSEFPGTTDVDSHYLTTALPLILASGIHGAAALPDRALLRLAPLGLCAALAHVVLGGTPLSLAFRREDYTSDENAEAARRIVDRIPSDASVQAPDALLPHLAERSSVRRAPPPEARTAFVVFDASHRRRFLHDEDLLRTEEEPVLRAWLARDDHALIDEGGDYLLLERDRDPREGIGVARYVVEHTEDAEEGARLASCLGLRAARVEPAGAGATLVLELVARGPCPDDLALRIGAGKRPRRVDLIADGLLSPAHFRRGDVIRSTHPLDPDEVPPADLRVGALRSSGARPEHGDPMSVPVRPALR
jgi:uncharacterized membrane protein